MKDRDFLIWLHERLEYVYKESELFGYMHKLRDIIKVTPKDQETVGIGMYNSLAELREDL